MLFLFALWTRWQYFLDFNRCVVTENELLWNMNCVFINLSGKENHLWTVSEYQLNLNPRYFSNALSLSRWRMHCSFRVENCTGSQQGGSLACFFLHLISVRLSCSTRWWRSLAVTTSIWTILRTLLRLCLTSWGPECCRSQPGQKIPCPSCRKHYKSV